MEKSRKSVKIVLDTNVLVAALLSNTGNSAIIFEKVIEQTILNFYTDEMLAELKDVLKRPKFRLEDKKQELFVQIFQEASSKIIQNQEFQITKCRDPKDNKFLSLANQIEADFLLTLDEDLLVIKQIGRTQIITPGNFLNLSIEKRYLQNCNHIPRT